MNTKQEKKIDIKSHMNLIETIVKVEYKHISNSQLIDFSELMNIGIHTVHKILSTAKESDSYNNSYLSTAIKWAIRNEIRRRYKWYSLKTRKEKTQAESQNDEQLNDIREAVYKTILSIDEMADAENPTLIKDTGRNPEENILFNELKKHVKESIKKLPQRERDLIEAKFYNDKKLRELSDEYNISASRISRIIQSGLNKIKSDLAKKNLIN